MQKQIAGVIFESTAAALMTGLSPIVAFAANNREWVASSEAVQGTFGGKQEIAAFWIWCNNAEGPNSHSYRRDYNGTMRFPALGISERVAQEEGITKPSEGTYVIHVQSRTDNGQSVDCTLSNAPPITSVSTNTVNVHCRSAPTSGDGLTGNAVVVATGPS